MALGTLYVVRRSRPRLEAWKDGLVFPSFLNDLLTDILVHLSLCILKVYARKQLYLLLCIIVVKKKKKKSKFSTMLGRIDQRKLGKSEAKKREKKERKTYQTTPAKVRMQRCLGGRALFLCWEKPRTVLRTSVGGHVITAYMIT